MGRKHYGQGQGLISKKLWGCVGGEVSLMQNCISQS